MHESPDDQARELTWDDVPNLVEELRNLATRLLARWPGMHSLQPTLLVCTALRRQRATDRAWGEVTWESRAQLFGQVFRAMEQKLIDYRRHQGTKGYAAERRLSIVDFELYEQHRAWTQDPAVAHALEVSLGRLAETRPDLADVVRYRFFAGLTRDETAEMLGISLATVKRRWEQARLIIEEALRELPGPESTP